MRHRVVATLAAAVLVASIAARAQKPSETAAPAPSGPEQPIPYSHRVHVSLGLQCRGCHVNPENGKLMTYPPTALCLGCHQAIAADRPAIKKLASFAGKEVPWVRVYKTPDYVFWQHGSHLQAGVTCAECHGAVHERDVIFQETNVVTMLGCRTCHDKRQVFTGCEDCHEPRS